MIGKPRRYEVLLTQGAEQDLESIHDHIAEFDSVAHANHVLDRLKEVVDGLARFPERGSYPKELVAPGYQGVPTDGVQALPGDLSRPRQPGRDLPDRRWPA